MHLDRRQPRTAELPRRSGPRDSKALNIKWQQIGTNAYWIQPYGADPRGATPDNDWHGPTHTQMTENLPHAVKKYGRRRKLDYRVDESYDEPYRMRNLLWQTKRNFSWTARENPAVPENNFIEAIADGSYDDFTPFTSTPEARDEAGVIYLNPAYAGHNFRSEEEQGGAPFAHIGDSLEWIFLNEFYSSGFTRRYAYGRITDVPNLIASTCEMYAKGDFPVYDTEEPVVGEGPTAVFKQTSQFDAGGDPVTYQTFSLFHSEASNKNAIRQSPVFGSTGIPTWPSTVPSLIMTPDSQGSLHFLQQGYDIIEWWAIFKWTGMRYCTFQTV